MKQAWVVLCVLMLVVAALAADVSRAKTHKKVHKRRHLVAEKAELAEQAPATAAAIATTATAAILGSIPAASTAATPANIPAPSFPRPAKCSGCLSTVGAVAGDAAAKGAAAGDAQTQAVLGKCSTVDAGYVSVCQYLSQQAAYIYTQFAAHLTPLEICAGLTFCDLGDAGILQASFTPLRADNF
eukprot:gnl/Hemi2/3890_TR1366_c0_g3_i1.p1 gnl/Hemi2/3890_TR1366_c0_g3~~gnl/Hemi2/3890_TR1366_c0_g3_i1.p1  ORF type:complete len:198 (-),score=89.47 gnl/Hemi2/3890_TR1366_c0_g3_i1:567-1121(-)